MKSYKNLFGTIALILIIGISSCKKYLDQKPQQSLVIPNSLTDCQALLDNKSFVNSEFPGLLELVTDNYYVTTTDYNSVFPFGVDDPQNYIWDSKATHILSWQSTYQGSIYYSNVVLDVLPNIKVTPSSQGLYNSIKGSALFYRAFGFFDMAQLYCKPYSATANSDLGIVLKLNSSINEKISRATVQQTYDQIINDFKSAISFLPNSTLFPTRPNKAAAYGALARTYLSMRDYVNAGLYADSCLQLNSDLMDFNNTGPAQFIQPNFNPEVVFYCQLISPFIMSSTKAKIDSNLYRSYDANDLRKTLFFRDRGSGTYSFMGSYAGIPATVLFNGITTDEMFLTRAECNARNGKISDAMTDLNTLMIKRWRNNGSFVPFTASDGEQAKAIILTERRKELLYRGLRWSDLRRLNLENAGITLTRNVNNVVYTLPPNDPRWIMLIPPDVISHSGIQQNPR